MSWLGRALALLEALQLNEEPAIVEGGAEAGGADDRDHVLHIGIGSDEVDDLVLMIHHGAEGGILRRLGEGEDLPGVLDREEALGHRAKEPNGGGDRGEGEKEGGEPPAHDDAEARAIGREHAVEDRLGSAIENVVPRAVLDRFQQRASRASASG